MSSTWLLVKVSIQEPSGALSVTRVSMAAKGIKQKKVRYADILRGTSFKTVALCVCVYAIFFGLGVISWFVWALPGEMLQTWMLFFFTLVWGFSMQQQFYQLWSSELFPVRYRATARGAPPL